MVYHVLLKMAFVFLFFLDDYNEARLKLPQAVDHTDLGSDGGESPIRFKRKRM